METTTTEKLTHVDFAGHTHTRQTFTCPQSEDEITVDKLEKTPGDRDNAITFTNLPGHLIVTGDWGSWTFCRNFVPGQTEPSLDYLTEKATTGSTQTVYEYSHHITSEELRDVGNFLIEDSGLTIEEYNMVKFLNGDTDIGEGLRYKLSIIEVLMQASVGERRYKQALESVDWSNLWDYIELVPFGEEPCYRIKVIYDAYYEIVSRLKQVSKAV